MNAPESANAAAQADNLLRVLFPMCRSITGAGVRKTLSILRDIVPFEVHEVPSGTVCFDWTIPDEWNVRDAFIADERGTRLVDFQASNVHLVSYSEPVDAVLSFAELAPHLHRLDEMPTAIPYRTSYYRRTWGFCLTAEQYHRLDRAARYRVKIDATLAPGSLTYGERVLSGTSGKEFLITTYCCHPSLANDNLSGQVLWTLLLKELARRTLRHSYRFVIAPETIGSIAYLARNEGKLGNVAGGFVVTTVGGPGSLGMKHSFQNDGYMDRVAKQALRDGGKEFREHPFEVLGSDERNFSGPAFRIPMATICKDKYYEYREYHTSLDNLDFVRGDAIAETLAAYLRAIEILEADVRLVSLAPPGEPQLGKRGLYPTGGGSTTPAAGAARQDTGAAATVAATLSVLFWADGKTSLLEVAERTGMAFGVVAAAASRLREAGLVGEARAA